MSLGCAHHINNRPIIAMHETKDVRESSRLRLVMVVIHKTVVAARGGADHTQQGHPHVAWGAPQALDPEHPGAARWPQPPQVAGTATARRQGVAPLYAGSGLSTPTHTTAPEAGHVKASERKGCEKHAHTHAYAAYLRMAYGRVFAHNTCDAVVIVHLSCISVVCLRMGTTSHSS